MFTGIASHAGALGAALVVLIGAAILHDGPAAADPNQDDRFLALLEKKEIPAVANVPRVIDAAHKVCRKLDGGMPVNDIVDGLRNDAYNIDPVMRLYPVRPHDDHDPIYQCGSGDLLPEPSQQDGVRHGQFRAGIE